MEEIMKSIQIVFSKILLIGLIPGLPFLLSCSNCLYCSDSEVLNIEYYSEGGFTGGGSGITIDSSGIVSFWTKNLVTERIINKTLKLKEENIEKICSLLKDPKIYSYKNNFLGNYTTYLDIELGEKNNRISFNKSDLPDDIPEVIKTLISELNSIE
jgi:hypothetical protein